MENAKIHKFIYDILSNFQELSMAMTGHEHKKVLGHGCMKSRLSQFFRLVVPENVPYNCYCKQSIESSGADFQNENFVYVSHVLFFLWEVGHTHHVIQSRFQVRAARKCLKNLQ